MPRKKSKTSHSGPFSSLFEDESGSHRKRSGCFRIFSKLFRFGLILSVVVFCAGSIYYYIRSLGYDMDLLREVPQRTLVYDLDEQLLGHVTGHGENRLVVQASEVSPHFIQAILAREDSRFYQHHGVDYRGVIRAMIGNIKAGGMEQGASTLTMQLARNTFGNRAKTLDRKVLEVAIAKRIERKFSKEEILGFYMNRIYFGSGLYGIERASQGFFMKPASDLTAGEGAMLAGIIRGPSLLNPFRSIKNAKGARDEVLDRMATEGVITEAEVAAARNEVISLRPPDQRMATGSYTLQTVFDLLNDFLEPQDIEVGGLKIYTTLDSSLQSTAEKALDSHLTSIESRTGFAHPSRRSHRKGEATRYLQGSVVSLDNSNGAILALVGGRDFGDSPFNRAYQAFRQAGSTFKPFVYANAFERTGLLPGAYVSDDPLRISHGGGPVWSPKNSDGTFIGLQPAAVGLIRSRNTMSVRVGQIGGLQNVKDLARALKFGELPDTPVIYLGAFETNPMTMTSAFSTIAAKGVNYVPYLIERIENADGKVLYQNQIRGSAVLRQSTAWITADILGKVMDEGTGASARRNGFTAPAYGKTGTTNDYRDAWFVGFTDKITTGVWVGLDQPKTIMNKGYGSTLALPVWTSIMKEAEANGYAGERLAPPPNTRTTVLCRECGQLQGNRTTYPYQMDLPDDLRPRGSCRGHGGLFAGQNRAPQAFAMPGELVAQPVEGQPGPASESGLGKAIRGLGRFIFGGGGSQ